MDEPRRGWLLPVLLAAVLAAIVWFGLRNGKGSPQTTTEPASTGSTAAPLSQGETVSLQIDFGDGKLQEVAAIEWRQGMTVADLMERASRSPHGIAFTHQGTGENGFLTSLGDVANAGAGGSNWIYQVNGQHAQIGFFLYQLQPGDTILWKFGPEQ